MQQRTVPDFFQGNDDEDLYLQVKWLEDNLGLDNRFLARVALGSNLFAMQTNTGIRCLPPSGKNTLHEFWRVVLHLLSHYNFDNAQVRRLLEEPAPPQSTQQRRLPWSGSSLKEYFHERGGDAVKDVNRWVTCLRFGDPYAGTP